MGQRDPLARSCLQSADAVSTRLLAVESLEVCFGTNGQELGKPMSLPSSTAPGKVFLLLEKALGQAGWDEPGALGAGADGAGGSRRERGGCRREGGGGRDTGCGNSPCGSAAEGVRSPAAQLGASCPLSGCAALPGGAPHCGRPLPGGCTKAVAEPRDMGVGAPCCRGRGQAPSHLCGCSWRVSHGCCSNRQRAGSRGSAEVDQSSVSLFSTPGVWQCPLLPGSGPSGSPSLGFCFSLFSRSKLEQHPCSASSWSEKPAALPAAGTRNHPGNVTGWCGKQVLLSHLVPAALGWGFGISGQDCEISAQAPALHRVVVLWTLHRA